MPLVHKNLFVGLIMSVLGLFGVYQTYYIFVPKNVAYKLKSENHTLVAFKQEYLEDGIEKLYEFYKSKFFNREDLDSAKKQGLIFCQEQKQTNGINGCRNLYLRPISDNESYEAAKKGCSLPATSEK